MEERSTATFSAEDIPTASTDIWLTDDNGNSSQMYVTVDTGQQVFPGHFVIEESVDQTSSASGTKLETLAHAASAQTPLSAAASVGQNRQIIVNGAIFPPPDAQPLPITVITGKRCVRPLS